MTPQIELRPAESSDEEFFYCLFAETRAGQFAGVGLPAPKIEQLMRMQFRAREAAYLREYPNSERVVISVGAEKAATLWCDQTDRDLRIIDIAVLPRFQGRGIARTAMQNVLRRAATERKTVRLSVRSENARARALYEQLGFRVCGTGDFYVELTWHAADIREAS
ncbi:MAG: GNAT family N-acetyltransferase [Acidobacteriaceae bacterium]|nr:GNAT family N-acetyltransferase [Acidobacteriaceae bacterium]